MTSTHKVIVLHAPDPPLSTSVADWPISEAFGRTFRERALGKWSLMAISSTQFNDFGSNDDQNDVRHWAEGTESQALFLHSSALKVGFPLVDLLRQQRPIIGFSSLPVRTQTKWLDHIAFAFGNPSAHHAVALAAAARTHLAVRAVDDAGSALDKAQWAARDKAQVLRRGLKNLPEICRQAGPWLFDPVIMPEAVRQRIAPEWDSIWRRLQTEPVGEIGLQSYASAMTNLREQLVTFSREILAHK